MAKSEQEKALEVLRDVESRIVWLTAFLVCKGTGKTLSSGAAKVADEGLAEYQTRFPPINPG
jgi:hypothetical protein